MSDDIERVLSFWFEPIPTTEVEASDRMRFWFGSDAAVDRRILEEFGELVARARRGELDAWASTPRGTLALIVLIDQFSRNLNRGSADAFSADDKALALSRDGYDSGKFTGFHPLEHLFAGMPFLHAEDLDAQRRGVMLCARNALNAPDPLRKACVGGVDFARKHLDVIARFGRFPHRNAVLGRTTTSDEHEYLDYLKIAGQWL